jgi:serine/threonine protein phosphatase 1
MSRPRTFVIGDIHGCADEAAYLLDAIAPSAEDTVVFLGDYVDRGPASKNVIDRLVRLRREGPQCVFLKGNHEDMFLGFLGKGGHYGDSFFNNGGEATLRSYGLEGRPGSDLAERLPPDHLEFLLSLQMSWRQEDLFCVHAGLAPLQSLEDQESEDMLWIRDEFVSSPHEFPFTILFGHTPHREVLLDLPYKVGMDTGLVYWNKLSCLEWSQKQLYQIRRGERAVRNTSLRERFESRQQHEPGPARQRSRPPGGGA